MLAEQVRFELTDDIIAINTLARCRLQPLGHCSMEIKSCGVPHAGFYGSLRAAYADAYMNAKRDSPRRCTWLACCPDEHDYLQMVPRAGLEPAHARA